MEQEKTIRTVELFAGVGGFRIGLEAASPLFYTVWSNQWEPAVIKQDASFIYRRHFGERDHTNADIAFIPAEYIPHCDLLTAGFPCQDYSVATTSDNSKGLKGSKGVLWWQIIRILLGMGRDRPRCVLLENVDRLLSSPTAQRGRDFAVILASLASLDYTVEWRVINAADYGFPQRRRRTYILAIRQDAVGHEPTPVEILKEGLLARAFPLTMKGEIRSFVLQKSVGAVSNSFNLEGGDSPFLDTGVLQGHTVFTTASVPSYEGPFLTLGDILQEEDEIPETFFIKDSERPRWEKAKRGKTVKRISKEGYSYTYSEGPLPFPDDTEKAARTITASEGGVFPSRFKTVVRCPSGRLRRLTPIELERLNGFPDNHTRMEGVTDARRAFFMGNALVTGIIQRIGQVLADFLQQ